MIRKEGGTVDNFINARFGDDGKLWHLGAALIVGITMWAIIIGATVSVVNMILDY